MDNSDATGRSETDGPNTRLESDGRFGPLRGLAERARKNAKEHQTRHVKEVETLLDGDVSIDLFSVIREPNGTGGVEISQLLEDTSEKPRIILLMNGLVNPQDIVQVSPTLEKLGMAALRVLNGTRNQIANEIGDGLKGDTVSAYLANTIKHVQKDLFDGEGCEVILVFNSSTEDLQSVARLGGENTVLVVGGHGSLGSLSMTNGSVRNDEIPDPEAPLKAFVQHTCAGPSDCPEEMGTRWANQTYGWRRSTSPIDFVDNPLQERG
jgi:hypothetical protein